MIRALEDLAIAFPRYIAGFIPSCTIEEDHEDDLAITEHPVEVGSPISDHAYKRPSAVTVRAGWAPQDGFDPRATYQLLLGLQASAIPFSMLTGKRAYSNMLLQSIQVKTDRETETVLMVTLRCRQVIIATTQTVAVPPNQNQANPQQTGATVDRGSVPTSTAPRFNSAGTAHQ